MKKFNLLILALVAVLPNRIKCAYYRYVKKATIHPSARIGISIINAKNIRLGEGVRIGHFNVINNLDDFHLGDHALIRTFNVFNALSRDDTRNSYARDPNRNPSFYLGEESTISSYSYFNCDASITIGIFSSLAGRRIQFFTHGIDLKTNKQVIAPIIIGNYCRILTQTIVTKGLTFPDYSTLGSNSVLTKSFSDPYTLYAGIPAKPMKRFDEDCLYFTRTKGFVE